MGILSTSKRPYLWPPRTAIWLAEQVTSARFTVQEDEPGQTTIICDGIGYTSQPQLLLSNEGAELEEEVKSHK